MKSSNAAPIALIVCTRNRAQELANLLVAFENMAVVPRQIVVVDSSDRLLANQVEAACNRQSMLNVIYIASLYGAPHQKNVGLDFVCQNGIESIEFVAFLDDDVIPHPNYFKNLLKLFGDHDDVFCFGGFDESLVRPKVSRLRMSLGLDSRMGNVVLRNGLTPASIPTLEFQYCEWVPGGMQTFRKRSVQENRFDGTIRIHGDEVEFQLRLETLGYGRIATSSLLGVEHLGAQTGKTNVRVSTGYLDGFRWRLATDHPRRVKRSSVICSTIILGLGELAFWAVGLRKNGASSFLGHLDFLGRLVLGHETLEKVSHPGSGPFVKDNHA